MRNLLCIAVVLMSSLFAGCTSSVFTPVSSPNPWTDDYSSTVFYGELSIVGNL